MFGDGTLGFSVCSALQVFQGLKVSNNSKSFKYIVLKFLTNTYMYCTDMVDHTYMYCTDKVDQMNQSSSLKL